MKKVISSSVIEAVFVYASSKKLTISTYSLIAFSISSGEVINLILLSSSLQNSLVALYPAYSNISLGLYLSSDSRSPTIAKKSFLLGSLYESSFLTNELMAFTNESVSVLLENVFPVTVLNLCLILS